MNESDKLNQSSKSLTARTVLGSLLVLLGGLFLLSTLDVIDFNFGRIIFSFPMLMIVIGVISILNSKNKTFGYVLLGLGILFMLPKIVPGLYISGKIVFPILIILLGLYILFRHNRKNSDAVEEGNFGTLNKDSIDDVAIFGGGTKVIRSDNFKGGSITAIFGGSEIDLSQCKLAEGDNVLDIVALFGGSEIIVPRDWNIRIDVTPVFGGFSTKSRKDPNTPIDPDRTLTIKGFVMFGGGEVKSYV